MVSLFRITSERQMRIICKNGTEAMDSSPCVATIGFFDGVHKGHHCLIRQVADLANKKKFKSMLITFPEHPAKVLNNHFHPQLLTTVSEKVELLKSSAADQVALLDFTRELSLLSAYEFMQNVLSEKLNVKTLVIGHDHRFGHNRNEEFDDYVRFGKQIGIEVVRANALVDNYLTYSSTAARKALNEGRISEANSILGYEYSFTGTVVGGFKVGRTIGFPTANINVDSDEKIIPQTGVYAVRAETGGAQFGGMMNIGYRPTLANGDKKSIEVHLMDFNADIYSEQLKISFVDFIRQEKKFNSIEELRAQLVLDESRCRSII